MLKPTQNVIFGCDPEFFFLKDGEVVESASVIVDGKSGDRNIIITDGVQAELNPQPDTCRQSLGLNISRCFKEIQKYLTEDKSLSADFSSLIKLSDKEFDNVSDDSKKFGCGVSYNKGEESKVNVDPLTYRSRGAGGHIHLGFKRSQWDGTCDENIKKTLTDPKGLIPLLDLLVGNTCVLLDRDKGNAERRKTYGRAGEYRMPDHGIEYRTLSNFWLRNYALMSFVMGLARYAVTIHNQSTRSHNYAKMFLDKVDMKLIEKAINENDFDLAYKNFKQIEEVIKEITPTSGNISFPLHKENLDLFHHFVSKGLDHWFTKDIVDHWVNLSDHSLTQSYNMGWDTFLHSRVRDEVEGKVYIAVYGTLKEGFYNHRWLQGAEKITDLRVKGFMQSNGMFPYLFKYDAEVSQKVNMKTSSRPRSMHHAELYRIDRSVYQPIHAMEMGSGYHESETYASDGGKLVVAKVFYANNELMNLDGEFIHNFNKEE